MQRAGNFWENDPVVTGQPAQMGSAGDLQLIVPPQPNQAPGQTVAQERATEAGATTAEYHAGATPRRERYSDESQLRQEFERLPSVQNYLTVVPQYVAAGNAADTSAGDLNLIYAFGKIMDPGSVVREGELSLAMGTGAVADRLRGFMSEIDRRGRLSPETRTNMLAELRTRRQQLAQSYNQARGQYESVAQQYGFRPENVVGQHPAEPYARQARANEAAANHEGEVGYVPLAQRAPPQTDNPLNEEQQALYDQYMRANPRATPEQITQFFGGLGMTVHNAADIVRARDAGGGTQPGSAARFRPPDISDMRGQGGAMEATDAFMRQAANAPLAGIPDYISAGIDAGLTNRDFGESLRREHAIDAYDYREHPVAAVAGGIVGSLAIPTGAVAEARTAANAARLAGLSEAEVVTAARSAAARRVAMEAGGTGAVHGALQTDGDASERIANATTEAIVSAALGYGVGRALPAGAGRAPTAREPLVDPVTERLNTPLESATPAERVAAAHDFHIDLPMGASGGRTAAILEKGLDISPASAGVMEDARRGTAEQVEQAAEDVGARYGSSRTLYTAGQAAQRGARKWISRWEAASDTAYNAIPIAPGSAAEVGNTRAALNDLTDIFRSNPGMADSFRNSRLGQWQQALEGGGLSWEDLKGFRSRVGNIIGEQRFSDDPSKDELRRLYAALSEDMRATASARGPRALRAFERANDLYRRGQERIDQALVSILGDDSRNNPEAAARAIQTIARSGRGSSNLDQLARIRASLAKGEEWDEVAGTLIRLGGQPAQSQGRAFNPQTFVQWYADMSEPARNLLFGDRGRRELRQALDDFVSVNQRLASSNALRNTSNTAPTLTAVGAISAIGTALLNPVLAVKLGAGAGVNYGMARLWTSPRFVRWATGYTRMLAGAARGTTSPGAISRQRQYLARLARAEPGSAADYFEVDRRLFGDEATTSPPQ